MMVLCFFFQAEDGIRDLVRSRGLGDVYKRQDMDCHIGLCLGCHREKTAQYRNLALHNSTDFESDSFRKNTYRSIS